MQTCDTKVLNLYAGLGGNRKLWQNVDVTAVEINADIANVYQENYPADRVIIADAHEYLLEHHDEFDFIWSSPPCQSHSIMNIATRHDLRRYPDMNLYQEIIFLDNKFDGKWVLENVMPYYEPLIPGKKLGRHLFWSNFKIGNYKPPSKKGFIEKYGKKGAEELKNFLGIYYEGQLYYEGNHEPCQVLRNCVHPKLGEYVMKRAQNILIKNESKQQSMFV